jgi:histidine triad (HIT) family protein
MNDCIFCKIANGAIPARLVHESDSVIAFHDLNPQAPHHLLVVPRRHIATVNDLTDEERSLTGEMIDVARRLATQLGVAERGYRLVLNCNQDGGQSVYHIHLHLLAGRSLHWPPG